MPFYHLFEHYLLIFFQMCWNCQNIEKLINVDKNFWFFMEKWDVFWVEQISLGWRGKFVCVEGKGEAAFYPLLDFGDPTMRFCDLEFGSDLGIKPTGCEKYLDPIWCESIHYQKISSGKDRRINKFLYNFLYLFNF